jgi:hypothetical protein
LDAFNLGYIFFLSQTSFSVTFSLFQLRPLDRLGFPRHNKRKIIEPVPKHERVLTGRGKNGVFSPCLSSRIEPPFAETGLEPGFSRAEPRFLEVVGPAKQGARLARLAKT